MLENIRLSFQGVWSHRLRSFLTMLGIIIGIAAIIAIVSTIKGTNEQIKKNLIGSGTNTTKMHLYMYPVHRLTTFTIMIHHFQVDSLSEQIPIILGLVDTL